MISIKLFSLGRTTTAHGFAPRSITMYASALLALLCLSNDCFAQKIQNINSYLSSRQDYVEAEPIHRLVKLASLLRDDKVTQKQINVEVRKNVIQHIASSRLRGSGAMGMDAAEEELYKQAAVFYDQRRMDDRFSGNFATAGQASVMGTDSTSMEELKKLQEQQKAAEDLSKTQMGLMAEIGAWANLKNLQRPENPLGNLELPDDVMNQTAIKTMLIDRRYLNGSPRTRLRVLSELKGGMIWSRMLQQCAHAEFSRMLELDTGMLPRRMAAEMRLTLLQQYMQRGLVAWSKYASGIEETALVEIMDLSPEYQEANTLGKLKFLHELHRTFKLSKPTKSRYEIPLAIQHLRSIPGFAGLDDRGKRLEIKKLERAKTIEYISIPYIEKALALR